MENISVRVTHHLIPYASRNLVKQIESNVNLDGTHSKNGADGRLELSGQELVDILGWRKPKPGGLACISPVLPTQDQVTRVRTKQKRKEKEVRRLPFLIFSIFDCQVKDSQYDIRSNRV